jgi:hypothetical protein
LFLNAGAHGQTLHCDSNINTTGSPAQYQKACEKIISMLYTSKYKATTKGT